MAEKQPFIFDEKIRITRLDWERIFLNVEIESDYDDHLEFSVATMAFRNEVIEDSDNDSEHENPETAVEKKVKIRIDVPIKPESVEGNTYRFHLNMAAMNDREFLENGKWRFRAYVPNDSLVHICTISYDAAYTLNDKCRIFTYGKQKYSYNVYFTTYSNDSEHIVPIMHSRFMIENPNWRDRYNVRERRTAKGKFRCILKKFKIWLMQATYSILAAIYPKKGDHILFMSETKPYIWGNLKFIDDRLKARGLDSKYTISYTFRTAVGTSNSIKSWFHTLRMIARQDYVFVDDFVPIFNFLELNKNTKLIQVWHAGEGFKSVGYSRFGGKGSPQPSYNCHKKYDYAITGSKRLVEVYSEVFGLPEKYIFPLGMARLDGFLDEDVIKSKTNEFYAEHPECLGKKLILFSPTFRGTGQKTAYYDYAQLDLKRIYDFCGDEYIWAFKMHPFIKDKAPIPKKYRDRIIDLTMSKDINDLYYVTDIMITDYSSAYFEYSILERPILFFTYDRVIYEIIRGVHKSIKENAPGKVCDTFDDLMDALIKKDYDIEKTREFRHQNFGNFDGHAADKIIDKIILKNA